MSVPLVLHEVCCQTAWLCSHVVRGSSHVPFCMVVRGVLARSLGVLFSSAVGGAYWPIAIPCPSLGPLSSIRSGAHRPLTTSCPPSPSLAHLDLSTPLSFPLPLVGCANGAPGLSLFHYSVSGPHRGGPLARRVQAVIPNRRWGTPPQRRRLGPGSLACSLRGGGAGYKIREGSVPQGAA